MKECFIFQNNLSNIIDYTNIKLKKGMNYVKINVPKEVNLNSVFAQIKEGTVKNIEIEEIEENVSVIGKEVVIKGIKSKGILKNIYGGEMALIQFKNESKFFPLKTISIINNNNNFNTNKNLIVTIESKKDIEEVLIIQYTINNILTWDLTYHVFLDGKNTEFSKLCRIKNKSVYDFGKMKLTCIAERKKETFFERHRGVYKFDYNNKAVEFDEETEIMKYNIFEENTIASNSELIIQIDSFKVPYVQKYICDNGIFSKVIELKNEKNEILPEGDVFIFFKQGTNFKLIKNKRNIITSKGRLISIELGEPQDIFYFKNIEIEKSRKKHVITLENTKNTDILLSLIEKNSNFLIKSSPNNAIKTKDKIIWDEIIVEKNSKKEFFYIIDEYTK
jgi:hypothetical protein